MDAEQKATVKDDHRRPELWVREKRPVNLLVLGALGSAESRAAVAELGALATIKGRGLPPDAFQHLTANDWEEIEVLFVVASGGDALEEVVQKAKNLRWIHSHCTGINRLLVPSVLSSDIPVTNAKDRFSQPLAEYTLFACNYFAKDLPRLLRAKRERKWDTFEVQELRGRTMGIIGLGDVGKAIATVAKAFKVKIIGVRLNTTLTEEEKQIIARSVYVAAGCTDFLLFLQDEVYGPEDLVEVMGTCDYVVAALPWTKQTAGMINSSALEALQQHAVFINVGRGETVEEPALIKALQEKRIKGAALDVFQNEPLPKESPLYDLDNVLLSSHSICRTENNRTKTVLIFRELLQEYIAGYPLRNLVDVQAGY